LFVQLALAFLKNFFVQQNEEASVAREKADLTKIARHGCKKQAKEEA
jgi:hypothetical protein